MDRAVTAWRGEETSALQGIDLICFPSAAGTTLFGSIPKGGQNTLTKQNPRHNKRNTRAAVWNFLALLVKCHPYYLPRSLIIFLLTAHTQKSYCMLFNSRANSGLLAPEGHPKAKRILTRSFAVPTMEEPPNAGENDGSSEWGLVKTQHHRSRRELPSGGFST